jgi:hypothetical protein
MTRATAVDGLLVQWGDRLFYPGNRVVMAQALPRVVGSTAARAQDIRRRIQATVARRAPRVMVKVTGGGRGMGAIAAHFRYISKSGRLTFHDDRGLEHEGKDAVRDLADQWRYGGSLIGEVSHRREAFNLMLSMPHGTDPQALKGAAQEFARIELAGHRWVMVLHEHQANPHVHLSVRAEGMSGQRLNPRKQDLQRWRDTFAERLRDRGVEAESTRQFARGVDRNPSPLWRLKAQEEGRLRNHSRGVKANKTNEIGRRQALEAWSHLVSALEQSMLPGDRELAASIRQFVTTAAYVKDVVDGRGLERNGDSEMRLRPASRQIAEPRRSRPEIER